MAKQERNALRELVMESARVQVATLNAGIAFWRAWTDVAGSYAQLVSKELLAASQPDTDSDALIGRLTDSSREYLRKMTELPRVAAAAFESEIAAERATIRTTRGKGKPRRAARAKE